MSKDALLGISEDNVKPCTSCRKCVVWEHVKPMDDFLSRSFSGRRIVDPKVSVDYLCDHKGVINIIHGGDVQGRTHCEVMRSNEGLCGRQGRLFEAKQGRKERV